MAGETQKVEELDTLQDQVEADLENSDETLLEDVSDDAIEQELGSEDDEKRQLQERVAKLERSNKQLYQRLQKTSPKPKQKVVASAPKTSVTHDFDMEDIVDLRVSGYSKEEIDTVKAFARGRGISSLSEAVKDPFITAGIKAQREAQKREDAQPAPAQRTAPQRHSNKPFGEMTEDERRQNFEKLKAKAQRGG
jgi:hypothetical protein